MTTDTKIIRPPATASQVLVALGIAVIAICTTIYLGRRWLELKVKEASISEFPRPSSLSHAPLVRRTRESSVASVPQTNENKSQRRPVPRVTQNQTLLATALQKPQFVTLLRSQATISVSKEYGPLFRELGLAPDAVETLKTLLAEKEMTKLDVMARHWANNDVPNRTELTSEVSTAQSDVDTRIAQIFGAQYQRYVDYTQLAPLRASLNDLRRNLSYSGEPLSDEQYTQLVQSLATSSPRVWRTAEALTGQDAATAVGLSYARPTPPFTSADITAAQAILSQQQLLSMKELQESSAARQELLRKHIVIQ